jgi:hypothetical protein
LSINAEPELVTSFSQNSVTGTSNRTTRSFPAQHFFMNRKSKACGEHYWHLPPTHTWAGSHCVPQVPQLLPSVSGFEQTPAQLVVPVGQLQLPFTQIELPAQIVRHWPQ